MTLFALKPGFPPKITAVMSVRRLIQKSEICLEQNNLKIEVMAALLGSKGFGDSISINWLVSG